MSANVGVLLMDGEVHCCEKCGGRYYVDYGLGAIGGFAMVGYRCVGCGRGVAFEHNEFEVELIDVRDIGSKVPNLIKNLLKIE